jgi:hypothetical protein
MRPRDRENLPRLGIRRASGRCSFRRNRSSRFPRANKVQFHPSPMRRSVHRPARELSTVGLCDRYRDPHKSIGRCSCSAAFSQSVGGRRTHRDISWRSSPKSSEFGIIDRHPIRHARTPASIAISQKLLLEARSSLVPLSHYFLLTCSASSARAGKPASCLCANHLAVALAYVFDSCTRGSQAKGLVDVSSIGLRESPTGCSNPYSCLPILRLGTHYGD